MVGQVDSDGNLLTIGSATVTNGFVVSGGNVGVGTQNPSSKLDVVGGSVTIRGSNAGLSVGTTNFIVLPGGFTGIGIQTSAAEMHIQTPDDPTISVTDTRNNVQVEMYSANDNCVIGTRSNHAFMFMALGSPLWKISAGGNISVGNSADFDASSLFDVKDGSITIRGTDAGLAIHGVGTTGSAANAYLDSVTGALLRSTSSRKYKEDIKPLKDDFHKILNVEAKSYVGKSDKRQEVGFIAEEFHEAGLQNLVDYLGGQPDSLKYNRLCVYLLEVVKDHQKDLKEIESGLTTLKTNSIEGR